MPMNEPMLAPNLEPSRNARNVEAARLFDRPYVCSGLDLYRVKDMTLVIEEIYTILCQTFGSVSCSIAQTGRLESDNTKTVDLRQTSFFLHALARSL
jgi:hypothetical protein